MDNVMDRYQHKSASVNFKCAQGRKEKKKCVITVGHTQTFDTAEG
jgi:hypothetical protein